MDLPSKSLLVTNRNDEFVINYTLCMPDLCGFRLENLPYTLKENMMLLTSLTIWRVLATHA